MRFGTVVCRRDWPDLEDWNSGHDPDEDQVSASEFIDYRRKGRGLVRTAREEHVFELTLDDDPASAGHDDVGRVLPTVFLLEAPDAFLVEGESPGLLDHQACGRHRVSHWLKFRSSWKVRRAFAHAVISFPEAFQRKMGRFPNFPLKI